MSSGSDRPGADGDLIRSTDAWFVREGMPQLVVDPDEDPDVNLRYFLIAGAAAATAGVIASCRGWWIVVAVVAGVVAAVIAAVVDNGVVRHRAFLFGEPRHRTLAGAIVPALVVGAVRGAGVGALIAAVVMGLLVIVVGTFMETFRLWKVTRWAARQTIDQLLRVFELFGRALPLLMLFAVTLFVNADVWQTAAVLDAKRYWVVAMFFVAVGVVFLLLRLPGEISAQMGPVTAADLDEACTGTPLTGCAADLDVPSEPPDLTVAQRTNFVLILMFAQIVQVVLVAVMIVVFFFVFGLFAIQSNVIDSWVGPELSGGHIDPLATFDVLGQQIVLTRELIRVCAFLGMLSGFYFTIFVITDRTYREDFFDAVLARVRRIVVVRSAYLSLLARAHQPDSLPPDSSPSVGSVASPS